MQAFRLNLPNRPRWLVGLFYLSGLIAIGYLILFFVLAGLRAVYPYELEWIEGAMIDQMRWILQGKALYSEPNIHFLPFAYTPFYFYLSSGLMKILGVSFLAPRLLSILATATCFLLLFQLVSQESHHPLPGVLAAGLYAATYRFGGAWMDLAKTDSLFLCLILAAFLATRRAHTLMRMILAGSLYTLAYYTKQMALPVVITLGAISLVISRGRLWPVWITAAGTGLATFFLLDWTSDGWYSFYTFETVTYHHRASDIWYFWRGFIGHLWPAMIVSLWAPLSIFFPHSPMTSHQHRGLDIGFSVALIAASWSIFLKIWTYDNGFLPACLGVAMLAGLGIGQGMKLAHMQPRNSRAFWGMAGSLLLLIGQFALLYYSPLEQLPTSQDREAAQAFVQKVKSLPGEVWIYKHGYYNYLAGKTSFLHSVPFGDVVGGSEMPSGSDQRQRQQQVWAIHDQAILEQRFDWVILDQEDENWAPYYLLVERLYTDPEVFYPATGVPSRPEVLLVRNPIYQGGILPLQDPLYDPLFLQGWDSAQPWGRWATGPRPSLQVSLGKNRDYRIVVTLRPACTHGSPLVQTIRAIWNKHHFERAALSSCELSTFNYDLPANWIKKRSNRLTFHFGGESGALSDSKTLPEARLVAFFSIQFSPEEALK